MVKLNIEMSMASLISRIARSSDIHIDDPVEDNSRSQSHNVSYNPGRTNKKTDASDEEVIELDTKRSDSERSMDPPLVTTHIQVSSWNAPGQASSERIRPCEAF